MIQEFKDMSVAYNSVFYFLYMYRLEEKFIYFYTLFHVSFCVSWPLSFSPIARRQQCEKSRRDAHWKKQNKKKQKQTWRKQNDKNFNELIKGTNRSNFN